MYRVLGCSQHFAHELGGTWCFSLRHSRRRRGERGTDSECWFFHKVLSGLFCDAPGKETSVLIGAVYKGRFFGSLPWMESGGR